MQFCKSAACFGILGVLFLTGCGANPATVSGQILLDGQPLTKGDVAFYSGGGGALAYGAIDSTGKYQLQTGTAIGMQPGTYQVTVVANDVIVPTQPYASLIPKLITPAKYSDVTTSGLTAEVKPGANTHNFELKSKP